MPDSTPTPERILEAVNAHQKTGAILAAIELDLFTAVSEGAVSVDALAPRLGASERGVRILCDYLVVEGFLEKIDSRYTLAADAAVFLDRRSPGYVGSVARFLGSERLRVPFVELTDTIRRGTTSGEGTLGDDDAIWVEFARGMAPMVRPAAEFVAELVVSEPGILDREIRVLDVAAGHGLFGILTAQRHPGARITALDWPAVLDVARENAEAMGVANRHERKPGSAFELDLGEDYDVVLLTNFLHHFDAPACTALLKKVHAALRPGGRAVTLEFVPNEDRVSPPQAASFALVMLATTPSGDAHTFDEYDAMFRDAGFEKSVLHPVPHLHSSVIVSRA